ncbi:hypothetical protein FOMPIDRAFT_1054377 [Fomitopsis schrenkii]|uniref:FMN-dependent dehydrogenase domain-containing protein n=1 Tax=Fomitopsis schrenkii TaxID=2126942 RepID=S8DRA9_FOMSC|nr:hypothetical protein FOMPIDRAFT_1054377 [Fomitopsis schrenkii]
MACSGLEVLVPVLSARGYFPDPNCKIIVDGGVRRASDILKALTLGANAVDVEWPSLYMFCSYGEDKGYPDLQEMCMYLLGARTINKLNARSGEAEQPIAGRSFP